MNQGWIWIDLIAALTMLAVIVGVLIERVVIKRGIGVRSIQFVAIGMLPPLLLVLALEEKSDKSAIFAVIGALVGYIFANIANHDARNAENDIPKNPN